MLQKSICLAIFLLIFSSVTSFTQSMSDSLILLNGRVFRGEFKSLNGGVLKFDMADRKGEVFTSELDVYRVFSYSIGEKETIVYKKSEEMNNFLDMEEARKATLGSYDARQTFKPRVVFWSSLLLGYAASIYDTYLPESVLDDPNYLGTEAGFFTKGPTFFPILVPVVLSVGWSIPSFKVKESQMLQLHLKGDEEYYRGYHRVAKQKRMLNALKGGLIGVGAGMLTYYIAQ
jgi:hypothetical protein